MWWAVGVVSGREVLGVVTEGETVGVLGEQQKPDWMQTLPRVRA